MNENNSTARKKDAKIKPTTIVGIILCVILLPILVINVMLIIKSYTNKDTIPSVGGVFPLIVLSDSMFPQIQRGDLIICRQTAPENVKIGDVICFFDPVGNGTSTVTHRVMEITETEEGELAFLTRGDANNAADQKPAPASMLVGVYQRRIPKAGNIAMFMQTTVGLIVCVVLPLIVLIAIDLIRTKRVETKHSTDTDALLKELEELRARQAAMTAAAAGSADKKDGPPEKEQAPPSVGREDDPPVKEDVPAEDEEELREKLREMGDPEPMDLDVAPAEAGLETGETGDEHDDAPAGNSEEGGGAGDSEGGGGEL